MEDIPNILYKNITTSIIKLNFLSLIDKEIESILPIRYEFPLEKIKTNIKEEQEYNKFIYSIFIPNLNIFINNNYSYYRLIALKKKIKYDKALYNKDIIDNDKIKSFLNNQALIIKLNEKNFEDIRNDILNRLFIFFINESLDNSKYNFNYNNNIENFELLNLKNFISYNKIKEENNELDSYEYKLKFKLNDYIKIKINNTQYLQFKFWFNFFIKKIKIRIIEIEYEYYLNIFNEEIIDDKSYIKMQKLISDLFFDYLKFVNDIINYSSSIDTTSKKKSNINLYLIDNINYLEELIEKIDNDFLDLNNFYKNETINNIDLNKLIYNNICIKLYSKYSRCDFKNFFENINNNRLENIIININNFNSYEYIELIKNEENIINETIQNSKKLFSFLSKFLIKIKKNKLKSIILYINNFNNSNILLNEIKEKFDEFMKQLIKQSIIIKNSRIYFSNIFNTERDNKINYEISSDSIYCFPSLDEKEYIKFNNKNINKKKFKLILFDNNISINKNKIIDFYFFEHYSISRITELNIGYFVHILELNRFLRKIKLYELCNMKKFTCYLKSNYKINEKSLSTFFKLNWPKNILTSIKIIFENFINTNDIDNNLDSIYNKYLVKIDMFMIFNSIIKEMYFKSDSRDDINKNILEVHQLEFEGTMIQDKISDNSLSKKLNIIKFKNTNDKKSIKNNEDNISTISYIQQSKNILLQPNESTINNFLKRNKINKYNYINDIKSVDEYHKNNNNIINFNLNNQYQKYPLKYFFIIKSENYLKYFLNNNKQDLLKNIYLYNEKIEINNIGKKSEEKYKTYLNFKKSLIIENKNMKSMLGLLYALNKTKNKCYQKLKNIKLRYKIIHYEYYQITPTLLHYIFSFLNDSLYIYNDFKHSNKLFKKVCDT